MLHGSIKIWQITELHHEAMGNMFPESAHHIHAFECTNRNFIFKSSNDKGK